ncbi:MAG: hypothetical protein WBB74_01210 [Gaiellaceae bacterium]
MSALQGVLSSPKFNRWLLWVAAGVLAVGVVAFLIAYFRNTAPSTATPISKQPAQIATLGKRVPLSAPARTVAFEFIRKAVAGNDAVAAYRLSGPDIRGGETLAQWKRDWANPNQGVPIVPYPADIRAGMKIDYSRQTEVQLKFFLSPRAGAHQNPQTFIMVLDRLGTGRNAHWVVNSWQPYAPPTIPSAQ